MAGHLQAPSQVRTISGLAECLRLLRIQQWIKNGFVLAPLFFAGAATDTHALGIAGLAFASFCLISSSVYVLNDWVDRVEDRSHPDKCHRPLASGRLGGFTAASLGLFLFAAGAAIPVLLANPALMGLEMFYVALNVAYSFYLKRLVILDVFAIASGFVVRVLAGAYAVNVECSHWILLCVFLLALFLGFAKRESELSVLEESPGRHRPVLVLYSKGLLVQINIVICAATIVCYALYTVAPDTVARVGSDSLIYSVPFVVYGLLRYLYLRTIPREGGPVEILLGDRALLLCVALWIVYCALVVYGVLPLN